MLRLRFRQRPAECKNKGSAIAVLLGLLLLPASVGGQSWVWTTETVDASGKFTSIAADDKGNLHISYLSDQGELKYGYRPAGSSRWFTMSLDNADEWDTMPTKLALDPQGDPHICYTPGVMKYASFDGRKWNIQRIAPRSGPTAVQFTCSLAIAADGTPHLAWYHYANADGSLYLHVKHGVLRKGAWLTQTIDFDYQTGKWNSLVTDRQGNPHLCYDSFANGQLKYAYWDGKKWNVSIVDSRNSKGAQSDYVGMGNALLLNREGKPQISYDDGRALRYARQRDNAWSIEVIDQITPGDDFLGHHTRQVLDRKGFPHISYESSGMVKHAYWDGAEWHVQVISPSGAERDRHSDIATDKGDTLYIAYRDAADGSLRLAVGRLVGAPQTAATKEKPKE